MEVSAVLAETLGRPLKPEEAEVLRWLSASGMAKLNSDLCRGVSLESSLAELQVAFQHLQARRESALERLSVPGRVFLGQLPRPWPTEAIVLAADAPLCPVFRVTDRRTAKGEPLADVLYELANEHLLSRLESDAQQLANGCGLPVIIGRLGPTKAAVAGDLGSPTAAHMERVRVRIGLSAVVAWFETPACDTEMSPEALQAAQAAASPATPTTPTPGDPRPRGILKPSGRSPTLSRTTTSSSNGLSSDSLTTPRVHFSEVVAVGEVDNVVVDVAPVAPSNDRRAYGEKPPGKPSLLSRAWAKGMMLRRKLLRLGR